VTPDEHERLSAQAAKFTPAELSRVVSLLLAAQADMRWTTSPRMSLELALLRATIPEADPTPAGLAARLERLERLAGVPGTEGVAAATAATAAAGAAEAAPPPTVRAEPKEAPSGKPRSRKVKEEHAADEAAAVTEPNEDVPAAEGSIPAGDEAGDEPQSTASADANGDPARRPEERPSTGEGAPRAPGAEESPAEPHAPSTGALDLHTIRRSWKQLLDVLRERRQMILSANLESATAMSWDGETMEILFPPGRKFGVEKVQAREPELQSAFVDVFGVSPKIVCLTRDAVAQDVVHLEDEDAEPVTTEDAVARLRAELGAEPEE